MHPLLTLLNVASDDAKFAQQAGLRNALMNLSFSFVGDSLEKISLSPWKNPLEKASGCHFLTGRRGLEIHVTKLASSWSNNLNSQSISSSSSGKHPATRATTTVLTLYQTRYLWQLCWRGQWTSRNLAVAEETRKGRFSWFCIRIDCAPYQPSKMHYVYIKNGELIRWPLSLVG